MLSALAALTLLAAYLLYRRRRSAAPAVPRSCIFRSVARDAGLALSLALIFSFTLIPAQGATRWVLVPGREILRLLRHSSSPYFPSGLRAATLNLILFVPLGVTLRWRNSSCLRTLATACLLSAGLEVAQLLLISGRSSSVDDVILNVAGTALGCLVFQASKSATRLANRRRHSRT